MKERILQLIPSFHQGGSERQAIQLTRLLKLDGTYETLAACLDATGPLFDEARVAVSREIPEFPLTSFYDLNMVRQLRRLSDLLKKEKIRIIQTHDFYTNIFGMASARLAGVPVRIASKRETGMRTTAQAFVERRAFGAANVVVVNSIRVKEHLCDAGVEEMKLEVIYNGVDHKKFLVGPEDRQTLREELGIGSRPDQRVITMIANVQDRVKNHEMFLRAAGALAKEYPDCTFVIAGEGERMGLLKGLAAELGMNGNVRFLGRCERVSELLSVSEICVLTSRSEGFSNAILEYMAAARPVVATHVGGAAEAIVENETGYLVPSDDDVALAMRLDDLLSDPEHAAAMGEAGKRRIISDFSMERQLEMTLRLYDRELRRSGNKQPAGRLA